jgi:hypothetical protein
MTPDLRRNVRTPERSAQVDTACVKAATGDGCDLRMSPDDDVELFPVAHSRRFAKLSQCTVIGGGIE